MPGRWALHFEIKPPGGGAPFSVTVVDHMAA
jgi:hypothetical protein